MYSKMFPCMLVIQMSLLIWSSRDNQFTNGDGKIVLLSQLQKEILQLYIPLMTKASDATNYRHIFNWRYDTVI